MPGRLPRLFLLGVYSLYRNVARGNCLQLLCYLPIDLGLYGRSRLLLRRELLRSHRPPQLHDLQVRERHTVALLVAQKRTQTCKLIRHASRPQ